MVYKSEGMKTCGKGGTGAAAVMRAVLLAAMVTAIAMFGFRTDAFAEIASGTSGTCSWAIDDAGVLTISPTDGTSGQMDSYTSWNEPWKDYGSSVIKVTVDPGVKAGAGCYNLFNGFTACTEMDLANLDTSSTTNMHGMFGRCGKLTSLDLSALDMSSATDTSYMFQNCNGLTSLNLSGTDLGSVTDMSYMFSRCANLRSVDISNANTSSVTNMGNLFAEDINLTSVNLSGIDTGNVSEMGYMFYKCESLAALDLSGLDTGSVTNTQGMFHSCANLTSLNMSGFDTSSVYKFSAMFYGCSSLTTLDVSGFDMTNATYVTNMFNGCSNLTELDTSGFRTNRLIGPSAMFKNCSKLTSIDVSGLGFDSINSNFQIYDMFWGCSSLTSLNMAGFDTSKAYDMRNLFYGCSSLTSLDLSEFDTGKAGDMGNMFTGCDSLSEITIGENFSFTGNNITSAAKQAVLPEPPTATTTGKWIRDDETFGPFTAEELRDGYVAEMMAGTWVWDRLPTEYTIKYLPPDASNYGGSMPDKKIAAAEDGTVDPCRFYRFDYHFDHWDGDDGNEYEGGQTIPAGTFEIGDTLTLTAVFERDDHVSTLSEGEMDVYLLGGTKATFSGIPGGTIYQIMEETPSGWQLVEQTGAAGAIPANGIAQATFTNEHVSDLVTVSLMARKTLDGRAPAAGAFAFVLEGEGERQEATNGDTGLVQFEPLKFRTPGVRTYTIREARGGDPRISYDAHVVTVTVTVEDDGAGNLTATTSLGDEVPLFENETKPGTLAVKKLTDGQGTGEELYTFEIVLSNESGMPLDGADVVIG